MWLLASKSTQEKKKKDLKYLWILNFEYVNDVQLDHLQTTTATLWTC